MNLINSLPEEVKNDLLGSVWSYYCNGDFKITGEVIFGYGTMMPLEKPRGFSFVVDSKIFTFSAPV
ncbi:MAG: hypothetical protein LBI81_02980 [Puniceicoccales bacterium]|jgi:hypothetical protein|nr:hypothetical protein [Puniceicoccales bacterium]